MSSGGQILLDTHALLWWATDHKSLSRRVRRMIEEQATLVFVSAASAWEIATKVRLGKLRWNVEMSVEAYCAEQRFQRLDVTFAHAQRAGSWEQAHGDPFDRVLAAQSEIERIPLATNDAQLAAFEIDRIW